MKGIEWDKAFYSEPTGYGSHGGYDYLCGRPLEVPWFVKDDGPEAVMAYTRGYKHAQKLWPDEESKKWFKGR